MPSLEVIGLSMIYGNIIALDNVTLRIEDKEYVCVIGPSGCGKSTLIKCIAGIIHPTKGSVLIDGLPMERVSIEDRGIGYVFQDIALFPHLTVRQNLSYGLSVRNAPPTTITNVTNEMLDLVSMRERSTSYPNELSGGAQQKVAVGRAVATGSHLFLLDEPLGALDALVRTELRYELRKLAQDLGLTVIHVTHDQEEALSIADRVIVMKRGKIVEIGKPTDIYHSPEQLFTENFVGETNLLEGTIVEVHDPVCSVKVGRHLINVKAHGKRADQRVVITIRPEFVSINESTQGWNCRIKEITYLGGITQYVARDEYGLELVAQQPSSNSHRFRVDDKVIVSIQSTEHMLLFDYPVEGLEKETSLE
ncbi:MAG: ABC transporter ATP-binding protein [Candidatus Bathyarchaeia archaeon]